MAPQTSNTNSSGKAKSPRASSKASANSSGFILSRPTSTIVAAAGERWMDGQTLSKGQPLQYCILVNVFEGHLIPCPECPCSSPGGRLLFSLPSLQTLWAAQGVSQLNSTPNCIITARPEMSPHHFLDSGWAFRAQSQSLSASPDPVLALRLGSF